MAGETLTGNMQVEWDGHLLSGMVFPGQASLTGWDDLPDLVSGDADKPSSDGAWPGRMLASSRQITWAYRGRSTRDGMAEYMPQVRKMLTRTLDERPLVIRTMGETLMCFARLVKRTITTDSLYTVGRPTITVQWTATDPRRYSLAQKTAGTELPEPPVGIAWPFTWPVTWDSSGGGSGQMECLNNGDTDTPAVLFIGGPVDTPSITNEANGQVLEFDLVLAEGETLSIDTQAGTADLAGADRSMYVTSRSVPVSDFVLQPGDNLLAFHSPSTLGGGDAVASISWRDAYL